MHLWALAANVILGAVVDLVHLGNGKEGEPVEEVASSRPSAGLPGAAAFGGGLRRVGPLAGAADVVLRGEAELVHLGGGGGVAGKATSLTVDRLVVAVDGARCS